MRCLIHTPFVSLHPFRLALTGHAAPLSTVALSGCISLTLRSMQVSPCSRRNQEVEADPDPWPEHAIWWESRGFCQSGGRRPELHPQQAPGPLQGHDPSRQIYAPFPFCVLPPSQIIRGEDASFLAPVIGSPRACDSSWANQSHHSFLTVFAGMNYIVLPFRILRSCSHPKSLFWE